MIRRFDLPGRLALFPLPEAVLMPRSRLPLQIFEPRYLQMIEDALRTDHRLIGMIQPQEGRLGDLAEIGCAGRIVAFSEADDGRYMITLGAVSRFRLISVEPGFQPYIQGEVDWSEFTRDALHATEADPEFDRDAFLQKLGRYVDAHDLSTDWEAARSVDEEMLINSLAMLLPFQPEEKQALLEAATLSERRELLDGLMEYSLRGGDAEETLQ